MKIQTGISTASLFGRLLTEDALKYISENGVKTAEIFLESFSDYSENFGKILKKNQGNTIIHSVHTLTTQFEPTLFSKGYRAREDSFNMLENVLRCAKVVGATHYTFHGSARYFNHPINNNLDEVGEVVKRITETCQKYGVTLCYENVAWCHYNFLGFFTEMKKRAPLLKGTLDIKQARRNGIDYNDFLKEMGSNIETVHISDVDDNGNMCLPGKGATDFNLLFNRLNDVGFNGAILIEAYSGDYNKKEELLESYHYINNLANKIF